MCKNNNISSLECSYYIHCVTDLFGVGVSDSESPLGVVGEHSATLHCHQVAAVLLVHLRRPVLITLPLRRQSMHQNF